MSPTAALFLAFSLAQATPSPPQPATAGATLATGAPEPAAAAPTTEAPAAAKPGEATLPEFGVALDTSFPQGVALEVLYRPLPFVRVWAGPAWNYAAFGFQAGVGVALASWAITPVLSVEAGTYRGSNISRYLDRAGGIPSEMLPLLEDVRYSYAATHLGFEFGSQRGFSFAVRLGLARLSIRTSGSGEVKTNEGTSEETTLVFKDPRFRGNVPSLKLGLTYWF